MFFFSSEKWNYAFLLREKGAVESELCKKKKEKIKRKK
jgi:hypothetical protein